MEPASEKKRERLTITKVEELLGQGKTLEEIGKEYFPQKPGLIRTMVGRLKPELLGDKPAIKQEPRAKIQKVENHEELFRLMGMVKDLAMRVIALEEALAARKELLPIIELGDLLFANRNNHTFNVEQDLAKEDNQLLTALEQIVSWLVDSDLDELYESKKYITTKLAEVEKLTCNHRHQIGPGHYSEVPAKF